MRELVTKSVITDQELADLYDAEYADLKEDIRFWKKHIAGKRVLEIGIGTGRLAIPLAKAGHDIVGIDASPHMLNVLQWRMKAQKVKNIRAVVRDMRRYNLKEKFDFAYIPFHLFHEMLTKEDQEQTLRTIRKHLVKGGKLGIDLIHFRSDPHDNAWLEHVVQFNKQFTDPKTGERWYRYVVRNVDRETQTMFMLLRYECAMNPPKVFYCELTFHYYFPSEIVHLVEKCGFRMVKLFGDLQSHPLTETSPKLIVIAERT
jgi:ubiquinone/menaquinone biosynthesis C-methylase UbiE